MADVVHDPYVASGAHGRIHQARCACGWSGPPRQTRLGAQADADQHEQENV